MIRGDWQAVSGVAYYKVYYNVGPDAGCDLGVDGNAVSCELLASNISGNSYTHANPSPDRGLTSTGLWYATRAAAPTSTAKIPQSAGLPQSSCLGTW